MDKLLEVSERCFQDCSSLQFGSFQSATTIGKSAFIDCSELLQLKMPRLVSGAENSIITSQTNFSFDPQIEKELYDRMVCVDPAYYE